MELELETDGVGGVRGGREAGEGGGEVRQKTVPAALLKHTVSPKMRTQSLCGAESPMPDLTNTATGGLLLTGV